MITFIAGIVLFKESAGIGQVIGSIILVLGVAVMNLINKNSKGKITRLQVIMLLISALVTTSSNIIDKYTTIYLTTHQVQFWFLLFVTLFSWLFFIIECFKHKTFLIKKRDLKNVWIYLVGIFLFVGDFMLFLAYKVPNSQMITISILTKFKSVVAVLAGIVIFKEKNVLKKILLSLIVILGAILIAVC